MSKIEEDFQRVLAEVGRIPMNQVRFIWESAVEVTKVSLLHDDLYAAAEAARSMARDLDRECERLKRIIARELTENDELGSEFVYVNALRAEVARYREALEFYADPRTYGTTAFTVDDTSPGGPGRRARRALTGHPLQTCDGRKD